MEKRYEWNITLIGYGNNNEEAWEQCMEVLFQDPGSAPEPNNWEYTLDDPFEFHVLKQEMIIALIKDNLKG